MSSPPPAFKELASTVEDYLTKADKLQGWSIDAIEEPEDNTPQVFPFANGGAIGAHLIYNHSASGVKVHADVASDMKSWTDLLPLVSYARKEGKKAVTVEYNLRTNVLSQTFADPTFCVSTKSWVTSGLRTVATATTRVLDAVFVGCCADYDPKRSGLNDFTVAAVRYGCPNVGGGDILAKYSLKDGFGLHVRVPLHPLMDAAVIAEPRRFIAGVQGRSPCGARVMLNANVNDGTLTATAIRNLNDIWKLSVSFTTGSPAGSAHRFGLKFSNDSMLE